MKNWQKSSTQNVWLQQSSTNTFFFSLFKLNKLNQIKHEISNPINKNVYELTIYTVLILFHPNRDQTIQIFPVYVCCFMEWRSTVIWEETPYKTYVRRAFDVLKYKKTLELLKLSTNKYVDIIKKLKCIGFQQVGYNNLCSKKKQTYIIGPVFSVATNSWKYEVYLEFYAVKCNPILKKRKFLI